MVTASAAKRDVVVAVLERDGRFLLGERSAHKLAAGFWCPICGSVEAGEAQAQAVVREVREETGLVVRAIAKLAECDTHDGKAVMHWWRVQALDAAPARLANDEHTALGWFTVAEMKRLTPIFLEDVAIFEQIGVSKG